MDVSALLAPTIAGSRRVFCCHRASLSGRQLPNSLAAVAECVEARAPRLEIDVRFLEDDGMLVFHDPTLDAETTGAGRVSGIDTAAARQLRYRADGTTPVPFLDEVVDLIRGSDTLLQVDLKLMRWMRPRRIAAMAAALAPIRDQVLIGSQAHWNVRHFAERGFRVALDPTLQWHFAPGRSGEGLTPARLGVHGLWDDAPLAHIPQVPAREYIHSRIQDLLGLLPASEWMVDFATIAYLGLMGAELAGELARAGVELAGWTLHDDPGEEDDMPRVLESLFGECGVTTVITDAPLAIAGYAAKLT